MELGATSNQGLAESHQINDMLCCFTVLMERWLVLFVVTVQKVCGGHSNGGGVE